jgi:hypothetical protein
MRFLPLLGGVGLAFGMATTVNAQWLDDFDSYALGPLAAQSAWEEWTGSSGVDANVDNAYSFTASQSVAIVVNNDVVYDFSNLAAGRPSSGVWTASIKTYVPSGTTGISWYILMCQYPTTLEWAVQTSLDASLGQIKDGSKGRKLQYDEWVSLVISIDLDNNLYSSWYGNRTLAINNPFSASGATDIAALDLYGDAGGLSGLWYDDSRLEKTAGGPLALTSSPNPAPSGANLDLFSESPLLNNGDIGVLFNWTVNGTFLIFPLLFVSFDVNGEWNFSTTVPPGLSGIEAGLKMFALPAGGKILASNEDVIIFL